MSLPPGLYERLVSLALEREIGRLDKDRARGPHIMLFVRDASSDTGHTQPYVFLGPADYVSHSGERPIAITWRLRMPMPARLFQQAKVAAG